MNTKATKNKISSALNIPNIVGVQSKKQKLHICNGIPKCNSFVNFCKNNTTIHNDNIKMTLSANSGKQL